MTALLLAVLGASLLGSLHCAGMCGAFVVMAVSGVEQGVSVWRLQGAYHTGRLLTYVVMGAVAGGVGAVVDLGGSMVNVQRGATVLAAVTLVLFGVVMLLRVVGVRTGRIVPPKWLGSLAARGHRAAWSLPPELRAFAIGLLTTLLPCGWLYAFVATAAGTGHPGSGAGVMAVFWVGTLPVLAAVGAGVRSIAGPLGRFAPIAACVLVIVVGGATLVQRAGLIGVPLPAIAIDSQNKSAPVPDPSAPLPCCHGH